MKTNVTGVRGDARFHSGFSLIELLVAMAIVGILAAAATPGFTALVNNNRLASLSNEFSATLQAARIEASRRGLRAVVCPTDDGVTCTNGARWRGWISFEDDDSDNVAEATDGNGDLNAGERILRTHLLTPPLEMFASGSLSAQSRIVFRHDGFAYNKTRTELMGANMRACIKTTNPPQNARDISLIAGGRVAVERTTDADDCGAPGNP